MGRAWYGLLTGLRAFEWTPSETDPERCEFVQWEQFSGILAWSMNSPGWGGGKATLEAFKRVNADLKREAERFWADRKAVRGCPQSDRISLGIGWGKFSTQARCSIMIYEPKHH